MTVRIATSLPITLIVLVAVMFGDPTVASGLGRQVSAVRDSAREQPRWSWPVGPPRRVIRPFEAPATRYSAGHRGLDLAAATGSVVLAPADGVVYFAGQVVDRPVLTIEYPGEVLASFEPVETVLAKGRPVDRGSPVGIVASGGHCDGACLHFGVRVRGEYVSPMLFLGEVQRAVLLPTSG